MNQKSMTVLEFNKIKSQLAECAVNKSAKDYIHALIPSRDYDTVKVMLSETDDAYINLMRYGSPDIDIVSDITSAIKHMEVGGSLNTAELLNVVRILRSARILKRYYGEQSGALLHYFIMLTPEQRIENMIASAIIAEDEIADNASSELSSIRRKIKSAHSKARDSLNGIIQSAKYQKYLQDAIITMRNNRFVVPVKAEYRGEINGIVHDVSSSGNTLFIEPASVVSANNELHELKIKEVHEIERILYELTSYVYEISEALLITFENIIKIDCVFAKAKLANQMKAACPILSDKGHIDIHKGRHPLIPPDKVVPIDVRLGEAFDTLVVTGPNTGGKTVVLKTVGLFCLMTQAGLHIPAQDGSVIAVFDNIFADIGDEQSIEQSLSTFSSHMKNIVDIIEGITPNSLVLFDELGAGTDPVEGSALAASILDYVKGFGAKTIATTHYSEIKLYALSAERVENASCEFNVDTLSPTYRLLIGLPGKSNAFLISGKLGLSEYIISRARDVLSEESIKFEDILNNIERNRKEAEDMRQEADRLRAEAEELKAEMKRQQDKAELNRHKIIEKAHEEARSIVLDASDKSNELLRSITNAQKAEAQKVAENARRELNIKAKELRKTAPVVKGDGVDVETLKPGTSVRMMTLNQTGTVISVNKKEKTALLQVGIMKVTAKADTLTLADEEAFDTARYMQRRAEGIKRSAPVKSEIDLRGMNLDDALIETDNYLDNAVLAGLNEVCIIHGKGSGILRAGIHDMLKGHNHVAKYRLGKYGEGENGVTIAQLR